MVEGLAAVVMTFLTTFVFEGATPNIEGLFTGLFVAYIFANVAGNRKLPIAGHAEKEAGATAGQGAAGGAGFVAKLAGLYIPVAGREFAQLISPRFAVLAPALRPRGLRPGRPAEQARTYDVEAAVVVIAVVGIGACRW